MTGDDVAVDDRRLLLGVTAVVLVASVAVAFGFSAVSENPLEPDVTLVVDDAPEQYDLNRSGTVPMVTVTHRGGESVPLADLRLVLGSRDSGAEFSRSTNWTFESSTVVFRTFHEEVVLTNQTETAPLEDGDSLTVAKTAGTGSATSTFNVTVRVFHRPSRTVLVREQVTVE